MRDQQLPFAVDRFDTRAGVAGLMFAGSPDEISGCLVIGGNPFIVSNATFLFRSPGYHDHEVVNDQR